MPFQFGSKENLAFFVQDARELNPEKKTQDLSMIAESLASMWRNKDSRFMGQFFYSKYLGSATLNHKTIPGVINFLAQIVHFFLA